LLVIFLIFLLLYFSSTNIILSSFGTIEVITEIDVLRCSTPVYACSTSVHSGIYFKGQIIHSVKNHTYIFHVKWNSTEIILWFLNHFSVKLNLPEKILRTLVLFHTLKRYMLWGAFYTFFVFVTFHFLMTVRTV
jgi:hypothetical protein